MTNEACIEIMKKRLYESLSLEGFSLRDNSHLHVGHGAKGGHYAVNLISEIFDGKSQVARHQMVYKALDGMVGNEIHALQITAKTPNEVKQETGN